MYQLLAVRPGHAPSATSLTSGQDLNICTWCYTVIEEVETPLPPTIIYKDNYPHYSKPDHQSNRLAGYTRGRH